MAKDKLQEILETGQFPGLVGMPPAYSKRCIRHDTLLVYGECRRCRWARGEKPTRRKHLDGEPPKF